MMSGKAVTTEQQMTQVVNWFTTRRFMLVLGLLIALAYPDALFLGKSFFFRDYTFFNYPLAYYHRECFWRGELPFWNPYNNLGLPFLAQWNTMVLYPGSLLYLLFPMPWSLGFFCLAHLFLGGVGMFLFVRCLLNHPLAAAFAGVAFAFNGFALTCLMWPNNIAAWAWLPWVLWLSRQAWQQGGRYIPVAALVGGMQLLSGGPEIIIQTWLLAGCFFLFDVWRQPWAWRRIVRLASVVLLAGLLAAMQLLPFLELLGQSQRNVNWATADSSMPAWGWLNLFVPLFGSEAGYQGVYTQVGHVWVDSYYPGILVTLFAVLAIWRVRSLATTGGLLIILLALALAMGNQGVTYGWLRAVFPPLGFIRFPVKFVVSVVALLPVLAAVGFKHLLDESLGKESIRRDFFRLLVVLALLVMLAAALDGYLQLPGVHWQMTLNSGLIRCVLFAVAGVLLLKLKYSQFTKEKPVYALLLLSFLWLDAVMLGTRPNPTAASWVFEPNMMRRELGFPRNIGPDGPRLIPSREAEIKHHGLSLENKEDQVVYTRMAMFDDTNLLDGLPKVNGFYSLYLKEMEDLLPWFYTEPQDLVLPLIRFAGLTYTQKPGKSGEWYKKWDAMPLVTSGQRPVMTGPDEVLLKISRGEFHPESEVYLPQSLADKVKDVIPGKAAVKTGHWEDQRGEFQIKADAPSVVVIAQAYYPDWIATVDGLPAELWKANHGFIALKVPAGQHEVILKYQDKKFQKGLVVSLTALSVVIVLFARGRRLPGKVTHA